MREGELSELRGSEKESERRERARGRPKKSKKRGRRVVSSSSLRALFLGAPSRPRGPIPISSPSAATLSSRLSIRNLPACWSAATGGGCAVVNGGFRLPPSSTPRPVACVAPSLILSGATPSSLGRGFQATIFKCLGKIGALPKSLLELREASSSRKENGSKRRERARENEKEALF